MKLILQSLLIWAYSFLSLAVLSSVTIITAIFSKNGDGAHKCGELWGKGMIRIANIRVEISGIEYLDLNHPQVIATNHQGVFDIFALLAYLPIKFRWVVKKELFRVPFLGLAMRRAGYIAIDRKHSRQALRDLKKAGTHLKTGRSVVIFPEGTRTLTGELGPFKRGSMLLATYSGNPVVPVSINGAFSILKKGGFLIRPGLIRMIIHPPIQVSELSGKEQKELTEQVRRIIAKDLDSS